MNLYLRKDGRYESRVPNGKKTDGRYLLYLVILRRIIKAITESVRQVLLPAPVITENVRRFLRATLMPHNGK